MGASSFGFKGKTRKNLRITQWVIVLEKSKNKILGRWNLEILIVNIIIRNRKKDNRKKQRKWVDLFVIGPWKWST